MIYRLNAGIFEQLQFVDEGIGNLFTIDITSDGEWIYFVGYNGVGRIYSYNQATKKFEFFQSISKSDDSTSAFSGAITDDHEWVFLGKNGGKIHVFNFNGTEYNFK